VVIFDCNGVFVASEPLATAIVSQEFMRVGFALTPDVVVRCFTGQRPADMFAEVEQAAGRPLPANFDQTVAHAILHRFRSELSATRHCSQRIVLAARAEMHRLLFLDRAHPAESRVHRPRPLSRPLTVLA